MEDQREDGGAVLFPIGAVARLTGVSEMTLRNWEKRYGVPKPVRTSQSDRRLYSVEDIALVRHLAQRVASGVPIRKAVAAAQAIREKPEQLAGMLLTAALALDDAGVQENLAEAVAVLAPQEAWSVVVVPVMRALGSRWEAGEDVIAAEHLASSAVVMWLRSLVTGLQPVRHARAAVACGPGELHELGTLALAAFATARGTPTVYLGANTPAVAIADIRRRLSTRVLCITATLRSTADLVTDLLADLDRQPDGMMLAFGGPGFEDYHTAHDRLAGHAAYLGGTIDDAVLCVERLCAER
jgi:DNA-binding transcriptional MerR regulator